MSDHDAVPVVAVMTSYARGNELNYWDRAAMSLPIGEYKLVCQRDHLATVSALQARIKDLERQKEIDIEQGNVSVAHYAGLLRQLSDAQARINALEARWNLCSACNAEAGCPK